jgi:pyruvate/oxaloacetate carboxyltransferase
VAYLVERVKVQGVIFSVHCHNDLGLAVANSLAALQNGARVRWSAPSTASASAPATRRSKRS